MIEWAIINSKKINRVGYNKEKKAMYIDFKGSESDEILLDVPDAMFNTFIDVKSPDKFYSQLVEGYFKLALTPQ